MNATIILAANMPRQKRRSGSFSNQSSALASSLGWNAALESGMLIVPTVLFPPNGPGDPTRSHGLGESLAARTDRQGSGLPDDLRPRTLYLHEIAVQSAQSETGICR